MRVIVRRKNRNGRGLGRHVFGPVEFHRRFSQGDGRASRWFRERCIDAKAKNATGKKRMSFSQVKS